MYHSSNLRASNLYQSQSKIKLQQKYSPKSRLQTRSKSVKVIIPKNNPLKEYGAKLDAPKLRSSSNLANYDRAQTGQKGYDDPKIFLEMLQRNLINQNKQVDKLISSQTQRQKSIIQKRLIETRQKTREERIRKKQMLHQHQLQTKFRQKVLKTQRSESSFIYQTHKDSINMIRKSQRLRTKSEISSIQDAYRETQRNHKFKQFKQSLEKKQQKYQFQYKKAMLKNCQPPKQKYSDLIVSKELKKNAKGITKLYSSTQKLPTISFNPKKKDPNSKKPIKKQIKVQNQLMISPMKRTKVEDKKIIKTKIQTIQKQVNPELTERNIQRVHQQKQLKSEKLTEQNVQPTDNKNNQFIILLSQIPNNQAIAQPQPPTQQNLTAEPPKQI